MATKAKSSTKSTKAYLGSGKSKKSSSSTIFGKMNKWVAVAAFVVAFGGFGSYFSSVSYADPADSNFTSNGGDFFCTSSVKTPSNESVYTCVDATIQNKVGSVQASITAVDDSGHAALNYGTILLYQCSGTGTNCALIAASHNGDSLLLHTEKPFSFGHTYKACGSVVTYAGWPVTNYCTAAHAFPSNT